MISYVRLVCNLSDERKEILFKKFHIPPLTNKYLLASYYLHTCEAIFCFNYIFILICLFNFTYISFFSYEINTCSIFLSISHINLGIILPLLSIS
jgi:hypothetical protein